MADLKNDQFIFHQQNTPPINRINSYYTLLGEHDFLDTDNKPRANEENNAVVAKSVQVDNKPLRYYIKVGTYGKIYNPIGLYSEGQNTKFLSKIGRKQFEFKEVNKQIFDLYVNFLATKNLAWLNNAERELN
jgi:hypothetical protein